MKVVTVLGARPQFIKAAAVGRILRQHGEIEEVLVHTGQHFDSNMSDVFFQELSMEAPKYNLGIGGGRHGAMTGRQLEAVEQVLVDERPDAVVVYGDTNSTLSGALAASKLHIPVAHVEAGLRSHNRRMPEEINRIMTDHLSNWLFAPTSLAMVNLAREGIDPARCVLVGDVMLDASLAFREQATQKSKILSRVKVQAGGFALATVHRAENVDDPVKLALIIEALRRVSSKIPVVWPVHPRTRAIIAAIDIGAAVMQNVQMIDPIGYLDMVVLESSAAVIATDSGGVQKEAFFFQIPCVTLRAETEWMELVESGWNRLVEPLNAGAVADAVLGAVGSVGREVRPYGYGDAAVKIVERLSADLIG